MAIHVCTRVPGQDTASMPEALTRSRLGEMQKGWAGTSTGLAWIENAHRYRPAAARSMPCSPPGCSSSCQSQRAWRRGGSRRVWSVHACQLSFFLSFPSLHRLSILPMPGKRGSNKSRQARAKPESHAPSAKRAHRLPCWQWSCLGVETRCRCLEGPLCCEAGCRCCKRTRAGCKCS